MSNPLASAEARQMDFDKEAQAVINVAHDGLSVSDYLRELVQRWNELLAREECVECRRGNFPRFRPHGGFSHHLPVGKNGGLIWMLCRANVIWKMNRSIADRG